MELNHLNKKIKFLKNRFANKKSVKKNSQSGFVAAEFLFSFVLVISCGIIVFALTFSLMTVEVAQYITWSAARAYSAAAPDKGSSSMAASIKFSNLSKAFPLLTDSSNSWFGLSQLSVGSNTGSGMSNLDSDNAMGGEKRHPWSGFSTQLELKLFKSLKLPFLGPITNDEGAFSFPLHAFILRNPSMEECIQFYQNRYDQGIKNLPDFKSINSGGTYVPHEDNGC